MRKKDAYKTYEVCSGPWPTTVQKRYGSCAKSTCKSVVTEPVIPVRNAVSPSCSWADDNFIEPSNDAETLDDKRKIVEVKITKFSIYSTRI